MTATVPLITAHAITAGYRSTPILQDVSFSIDTGAFIGIIGPNGAGKTTLFNVITGLRKPWSGTVQYKGQDRYAAGIRPLAREIATMPQSFDYSFPFTVEEFVMMGRFPHLKRLESPKQHDLHLVEEGMKQADVLHLRHRCISELSGGERQLAALAQALAQEPQLLMLDEPTAHLDIGHQMTIMNTIKRLNQERGITVITVLHDLNLAAEYCGRLLMLHQGRLFAAGTPEEILTYQNIEAVYRAVVLVKKNPLSGKPYSILVSEDMLHKTAGVRETC